MQQAVPVGIGGILEQLHHRLDSHFKELAEDRRGLGCNAPVFALEHELDPTELSVLDDAVQAAVAQGFGIEFRQWWLPFIVYAAELGYGYVGGEYWHTFEDKTPRWDEVGDRGWVRSQFTNFAEQYGGVRPTGAFARNFPIIAWPITHAVLPIYLQRNLARLLYEFRGGLVTDLLNDPEALGARLAARADAYTERFRIFCANTSLLGSVAVALLGEGGESPYLVKSTQQRLVEDLSREQESLRWLTSARQAASHVRAKGFAPSGKSPSATQTSGPGGISPPRVDPTLRLRLRDGKWQTWALLPELSYLNMSLGEAANELRGKNALVQGIDGMLPTDMHLRPGQIRRLKQWPRADAPFIQLNGVSADINALLATQCAVQGGPAWLFRLRAPELADQVKGRVIRPGRRYIVVQSEGVPQLQLSWAEEVALEVPGVRAAFLEVPSPICDADRSALVAAGLNVVTEFSVQPVGLVASSWDGEGEMEWLAGESAAISISSDIAPQRCDILLDGNTFQISWPAPQRDLFLEFADMKVGRHELGVRLIVDDETVAATETLFITIRDPQIRPESATAAEGIRMFASPSRPTLADLWDGNASLTIEGPPRTSAKLTVSLKSENGDDLAQIDCPLELPVSEAEWSAVAEKIRNDQRFSGVYDDAESVEIEVSREGIGFATLTCDRGFQPLRWKINQQHHGNQVTARLVDRTDARNTQVDLFTVDDPLTPKRFASDAEITIPALGGLLRAISGEFQQSIILPPQPMEMLHDGRLRPQIQVAEGSKQELVVRLASGYRMWKKAEMPGSVFAQAMRDQVLKAIARQVIALISGKIWAAAEREVMNFEEPRDHLEELQAAVGIDQRQATLADKIVHSFWKWQTPLDLIDGFHKLITPELNHHGITGLPTAFLLELADLGNSLDDILDWNPEDCERIIAAIIQTPVLIRAARFAVLGARLFIDPDEAAKGF